MRSDEPSPSPPPPHDRAAHTLVVEGLSRTVGSPPRRVLADVSFTVRSGEVLFVRGPSGAGKSLLLRAVAQLDAADGRLSLDGASPSDLGAPAWRARVAYVHQQRVAHPGTPAQLYFELQQLRAQRGRARGDLPALVHALGLEQAALNQPWSTLSGGQAQRCALAIAVALGPAVLLLDEPTSALDERSARAAERVLRRCGAALVWVTHDAAQAARVGGRVLSLPAGVEAAVGTPPASPADGLRLPGSLPPASLGGSSAGGSARRVRRPRFVDSSASASEAGDGDEEEGLFGASPERTDSERALP